MTSPHTNLSEYRPSRGTIGRVVLVAAILAAGAVVALGATNDATAANPTEEAVVVGLDESGDATLTLTTTFDLTDPEERTDFEQFQGDRQRQEALLDRYEDRLTNVATAVNANTDRKTRVVEPRFDSRTEEDGTIGVAAVTVTWERLAAVDRHRLRLTSPFDGGFAPDRTLIVEVPDEYRIADATPEAAVDDRTATWGASQILDGFVLTAAPADGAGDADATGPGFGLLVAVVAGAAVVIARRHAN